MTHCKVRQPDKGGRKQYKTLCGLRWRSGYEPDIWPGSPDCLECLDIFDKETTKDLVDFATKHNDAAAAYAAYERLKSQKTR